MSADLGHPERATLVGILRRRADAQPDQRAYTFIQAGMDDAVHMTYGELDRRARAIGARLRQICEPGDRVLLLYPPGFEYIAAFFGCLYAGVVAVPAYPPQRPRAAGRVLGLASDAEARLALTNELIAGLIQMQLGQMPELSELEWLATDALADPDAPPPAQEPAPDSLAFLQYTSGSTSAPKGVTLTHANLTANLARIQECFGHTAESRGVIWLPPYHDMGLIGGILQPLYVGFPVLLMSPMTFLQSPFTWLKAVSETRATTSGGPNFAFELCMRKITPEQRATLDLSSWEVAFVGAEPVSPRTLERFAQTFGPHGFRREAFYPCYGLAEATLIVSGGDAQEPPVVERFDAQALEQHRAAPAGPGGRALAGCGWSVRGQRVEIVHPETRRRCGPGEIGEIWVAGPSVAQGYWRQPAASEATFRAAIAPEEDGPFLRTGDLGFAHGGQLYITGRLKDLLIIRGRNHYPQDIEQTVEGCHPLLRPGAGAAFSVERDGEEQLVVVQELDRRAKAEDCEPVLAAIRQALVQQHDLHAHAVVLVRHGSVPKTSSGKIQRRACRAGFLAGELEALASGGAVEPAAPEPVEELDREQLLGLPQAARQERLRAYLAAQLAQVGRLRPEQIDTRRAAAELGLDSLMAVELAGRIEQALGLVVPPTAFLSDEPLDALLAGLGARLAEAEPAPAAPGPPPDAYPLSYGQRALWFLHQLAPESAAYNIAGMVRIGAPLDAGALRAAFQALVERHPLLGATVEAQLGAPVVRLSPRPTLAFGVTDAAGWSEAELARRGADEAHRPFDLAGGPLLRVQLYTRADDDHALLLAVHHCVADFWSLAVLMREAGELYDARTAGRPARLGAAPQYHEYAAWQQDLLARAEGQRLWDYWRQKLGGELPALNLPARGPRPATQTYSGATVELAVDAELTARLRRLGAERRATLFATLLAAFKVLLFRYTQQPDLIVGTPTTGRSRVRFADVVGYLVNPVALRSNLGGNPTFHDLLAQVRETVLEALAHQDYPFALLAEQLQPTRDPSRSPIFQVLFSFQQAPHGSEAAMGTLALHAAGGRSRLGALPVESLAIEQRTTQFDLMLTVAEAGDGLAALFQYNTDLFEHDLIAQLAAHFRRVLDQVTRQPERRIGDWSILTGEERRRVLRGWNATGAAYPADVCVHQLFEAQALRTPDAPALVFQGRQLSYDELNRRANQCAHYLRRLGVGRGSYVGVRVERSVELLVGLLGALKAGAAYLPLDPSYPQERLAFMLGDTRPAALLTQRSLPALPGAGQRVVHLDTDWPAIAREPETNPASGAGAGDPAYVIYTSGSTGRPKGVIVGHRGVVNFFAGMDERIGCGPEDTVLAVTSAAFDISVLELFWTLARGARVVLLGEHALSGAARPAGERADAPLAFSLFYFASADSAEQRDKYRLLIEGARFADERGFAAVWTPERHFHAFGGLYPNPAVTGAAVAAVTKRVQIRGGSVVLPLHSPLRVAEEWSVVDNLSGGRAGVALASGWHADDFALQPAHYADRKGQMLRGIETVQRLWRGEAVRVPGGLGQEVAVQIYPRPVQPQLPIWLTAAGNPDTFEAAGRLGAGVLTHLLGQSLEDVAEKIRIYRASLERHGHPPERGHVTLMLHTFLGRDREAVRAQVREPFISYLRSSADLMRGLARSMGQGDPAALPARDLEALLAAAFERYFDTSALFGTPESCAALVGQLRRIGVDEVACLIDFGVAADAVLESLELLDELRLRSSRPAADADYSLAAQAQRHQATLLQCTPSLMRMVCMSPQALEALRPLRALLLGGEALPPALAEQVRAALPARLVNMYGPTETTIWSATHEVAAAEASVPIGRPIANTQIYVLDPHMQPVPPGVAGELYIGGDGLAHGYLRRPETTAERFVPNPFWDERPTTNDQRPTANDEAGLADEGRRTKDEAGVEAYSPLLNSQFSILNSRLYRTGDLARHRPDGTIEFLGRIDQQVKLRGYRIELEEIEQVLGQHPGVGEAVVLVEQSAPGDARLVAYVVPAGDERPTTNDQRPTTNDQRPTTNGQGPAVNGQRSTTSGQRPAAQHGADEGRRTQNEGVPAPALHRSIAPAPRRPGAPTTDQRPTTNDQRPTVGGVSAGEGSAAPPLHGATASLRAFLRERLPDYMVPAAFVVLEALPLTANGKLDRKALAASAAQQARPGAAYVAPGSQIERTIAEIWSRALKLERVGVEDNFFDLGGHSLLMAQVHSQLQSAFQREFPLVVLLERPTVQALAQYFSQQPAQPALQSSQDRARRQTQSLQRQRQRIKGNAT